MFTWLRNRRKPKTFHDIVQINYQTLEFYTQAIQHAHGKDHPEVFDVRKIFKRIMEKVNEAEEVIPNLDAELSDLREVTKDYAVPKKVCGIYASTYDILSKIEDRKSTRLNSSHVSISYAVSCLKKKKNNK